MEGADELPAGAEDALALQAPKRVAIRFKPVRTATWDHRKLGGVYCSLDRRWRAASRSSFAPAPHERSSPGIHDGAFVVRLAAKPVEGAANKALRKFIAERVGAPPSRVRIVRGERSRRKRIAVEGVSEAELAAALST